MPAAPAALPVTLADVRAAALRLRGVARVTPLLTHPALDEAAGARVLVKAEGLQVTGSFKLRGAVNRVAMIPEGDRARGVVAVSSGNHGQAVAFAARRLGMAATVVMPADAPRAKSDGVRALGGTVVEYDRAGEDRVAIAGEIVARTGATLVLPFDDPGVIAGQGTVGLEAVEQAAAMGLTIDAALCCCGGGGLVAGLALALTGAHPAARVLAVEPEGYDDTRRSLLAGERLANAPGPPSVCDAILTDRPGALTFPINRRLLAGAVAVSDEEAMLAVAFAARRLKVVLEPGGAVALAAALARRPDLAGATVLVVASGANADPEVFARALALGEGH